MLVLCCVIICGVSGEGATLGQKDRNLGQKRGPNFVTAGAPGRGVLRFLARGYRNPVHFLGIFAFFSQN